MRDNNAQSNRLLKLSKEGQAEGSEFSAICGLERGSVVRRSRKRAADQLLDTEPGALRCTIY